MSQFEFDDMDDLNEEYYFDTIEEFQSERYFVLVIYDIVDNKKRLKLSKYLLGYGIRVQKSAFEMMITKEKYNKLIKELPTYIEEGEDSIRLYKILGKGQMKAWTGKFGGGNRRSSYYIENAMKKILSNIR